MDTRLQKTWAQKVAVVLTEIVVGACVSAHAQSFHPIQIPPAPFRTESTMASVLDISPDGSRVAGTVIENGVTYDCSGRCTLPFIWTVAGGTEIQNLLGRIELYKTEYRTFSLPVEEVVGVTAAAALANGFGGKSEPFVFSTGAYHLLRDVSVESPAILGAAMSDDAKVIVGSVRNDQWQWQPVRWTKDTGFSVVDVGEPTAKATGISGDGRVIADSSGPSIYDPYIKAFRWSENEGLLILDPLSSRGGSFPTGISTDGSVIVGTARGDKGFRAYRWTEEQGTVAVELPKEFAANTAEAVSGNGDIVVGRLLVSDNMGLGGLIGWNRPIIEYLTEVPLHTAEWSHAMIWDIRHGTRLLKDVLVNDFGLADELAGWSLVSASAISTNGSVIAGVGVNPAGRFQGWVVFIPEPHTILLAVNLTAFLVLMRFPRSSHRTRTIMQIRSSQRP